ncbi:hypothetical protein Hdeb2414_s0025g00667351 [Helianthus debilis subsp. tardiflorus]
MFVSSTFELLVYRVLRITSWPLILQLANASMEYNPLYDADKGFSVMPSSFHDIGDKKNVCVLQPDRWLWYGNEWAQWPVWCSFVVSLILDFLDVCGFQMSSDSQSSKKKESLLV